MKSKALKSIVIVLAMTIQLFAFPRAASARDFTVIIDAGHGGKDFGAVGKTANEKTINLNVALKLGKLIESGMKDVKVVYTRKTDVFVTLQGRANIANKSDGDLFISIHTNSVDKKSKNRASVKGASVYTLGFSRSAENLAVAMRENSVMKLESDYTTTYEGFDPTSTESYIIFEMSQNKHMEQSIDAAQAIQKELIGTADRIDRGVRQANYWVLLKTSMPAVLVELDFICNPTQEEFLSSDEGQTMLANAIYNGFIDYKAMTTKDGSKAAKIKKTSPSAKKAKPESVSNPTDSSESKNADTVSISENQNANKPVENTDSTSSADELVFKIQFLTSAKKIPATSKEFKDIGPVGSYSENGVIKYFYDGCTSMDDANRELKTIKQKFPDAFIIKMRNGKRVK